jgi:UDP-N-acetylglucosamine 1-carboxyvinyltransferase
LFVRVYEQFFGQFWLFAQLFYALLTLMTDRLVIQGLGGAKTLEGEVNISGAKNAVLKEIASAVLFEDELKISNVPDIQDVTALLEIMKKLGFTVERSGDAIVLTPTKECSSALPDKLARSFRASIVLSGPILARTGEVSFPYPGGDKIGLRPIDLFLEGFQAMGAEVFQDGDVITVRAPKKGLHGARVFFRRQTVTGTEALMMAAVLAEGKTILENAAMEPEIKHLAEFLNECGAHITGAGEHTIVIEGGTLLKAHGVVCKTPPDRIDAGTFLILGALAARNLTVNYCNPEEMKSLFQVLRYMGVPIEATESSIKIVNNTTLNNFFQSTDITTHEYPGFPTDLQAPMTVLLTQVTGESVLFETIWEDRFRYIERLKMMGADITQMDQHRILIKGPHTLTGRTLRSPDIRAGLAYVMAGIAAEGESVITDTYHIDRGYEKIESRLQKLGLDIHRLTDL